MRLIIVRHGETDRNIFDLYTGPVDVSLNETGRQQADRVGQRLASEKIHVIYSSDLRRARETTEIIASHQPGTPIEFDRQLRERDSGRLSGHPRQERDAAFRASGQSIREWRPAGGESFLDLLDRARRWLDRHRVHDVDRTVLVVSHGLFIHALLECAVEEGSEVEHEKYHHDNTGVTILEVPSHGRADVIHLNDTSHLD